MFFTPPPQNTEPFRVVWFTLVNLCLLLKVEHHRIDEHRPLARRFRFVTPPGRPVFTEAPSDIPQSWQLVCFEGAGMAERGGFEPPELLTLARFPGVCLKPLSHLSTERLLLNWASCLGDAILFPGE